MPMMDEHSRNKKRACSKSSGRCKTQRRLPPSEKERGKSKRKSKGIATDALQSAQVRGASCALADGERVSRSERGKKRRDETESERTNGEDGLPLLSLDLATELNKRPCSTQLDALDIA